MGYDIIKKIISHNNPGDPLTAKGIVIHETANDDDSAEIEYKYFNSADRSSGSQ
jgi:N-acetylmuramoyl-L-alanine amidase CwlA